MLEFETFANITRVMMGDFMYEVFLKYLRAAVISGLADSRFITLRISRTNCQNSIVSASQI